MFKKFGYKYYELNKKIFEITDKYSVQKVPINYLFRKPIEMTKRAFVLHL